MKPQIFLLAVLTASLWGSAPLFEKIGLGRTSPLVGLAVRSIVITIGILAVVALTGQTRELINVDRKAVFYMAIGAVLSGFIGQLVYFYVLKVDEASRIVPLIAGVYPLVAVILAVIVLREPVTAKKALGAILVIAGAAVLRLR